MIYTPLQKYKENWLLLTFILLFSLGVITLTILDTSDLLYNSRLKNQGTLPVLLLFGIFFAPLLEELAFRGMFVDKKKFTIISLILITFISFLSYTNYYALGTYFLFMLTFFLFQKKKSIHSFIILSILNSTLFGLVHYTMADFTSFEKGFIILFQVSFGFLLIWTTINFSLIRSVFLHAVYNLFMFSFLIVSVQFPDTKIHIYHDENIEVEWQKTPYFQTSSSKFSITPEVLEASNTTIGSFYEIIGIKASSKENKEIIPIDSYMKYNFKIILKKKLNERTLNKSIDNFFLKEKLLAFDEIK